MILKILVICTHVTKTVTILNWQTHIFNFNHTRTIEIFEMQIIIYNTLYVHPLLSIIYFFKRNY